MAELAPTNKKVRCVIVTPEREVVDRPADYVSVTLSDGELGVEPGRAALIGTVGMGAVRFLSGDRWTYFYVDGGIAQVRADVVTVLTPKAIQANELDVAAAERTAADPATSPKDLERARAQIRTAAAARHSHASILELAAE